MNDKLKMSTKYNPTEVEKGMYQKWLDDGEFKPSEDKKAKPYSIVLPPPNVTGKLHLGHAWNTTLQDMLIRQKRMQGYDTSWIPGMDHAGIATQAKVEAKLKDQGITRYDLGREKFVDKAWDWTNEFAKTIHSQWAKLGISLDYDKEYFTLDDNLSKAVKKVFVDLYNEGLIYRAEYIINWDPQAKTALSDIEVVHQDDKGAFYHVKYPFADDTKFNGNDFIEIATTRPETMMGDVAVAVNPEDERYKDLVGKELIVPLVERRIPIIADAYVDKEFGTGMVKITPAHDPNDFKVGNRHNLERINTMNEDATMNENAGKYVGMDRFEARKAMVADLENQNFIIKIDPLVHSVGHSERTGVQVESRLSTQWFVKMETLAKDAIKNQSTDDAVNFVPKRFENTFNQWMDNIHDWVISRQLWWGHQIPAWYHKETGEMYVGEDAPKDIENWEQDQDVLDTWFSSALVPFSSLEWPNEEAKQYQRYFPSNTLVTGEDIIFFWVSRMIFQSKHFTNKAPFRNVLLHGLIRDEQGRKMSKSLGNGIDPMDVIDQYGADSLRWFLSNGATPGQDLRFSYTKMDSAWNFINKIWNASRYVIMNLDGLDKIHLPDKSQWDLADKWIMSKLNKLINHVNEEFDKFNFGEANRALYNFIWNDFCDWYIEMTKEKLNSNDEQVKINTQNMLGYVLDQILRLIHPVLPFISEKIWLSMPHDGQSLVNAKYPEYLSEYDDDSAESDMNSLIDLIKAVRNIRSEANAPMSSSVDILIKTANPELKNVFENNRDYIDRFCHPEKLEIGSDIKVPNLSMTSLISDAEISIPLAELVDLNEEFKKIEKDIKTFESEVKRADGKLANEKFVNNAPEKLVEEEKQKKIDNQTKMDTAKRRLEEVKKSL